MDEPPLYQIIADKALHLHQLGMNYQAISKHLNVSGVTVKKAIDWLNNR